MVIGVSPQRFLLRSIRWRRAGKKRGNLLWLLVGLLLSSCTPLIVAPTPAASQAEPVDVRLIVQVTYPTVEVLNALAGELDVWEVDRSAQTFVARVTLEQYDALLQQDLPVKLDCAKMRQYAQDLDLTVPPVAQLLQAQCPE